MAAAAGAAGVAWAASGKDLATASAGEAASPKKGETPNGLAGDGGSLPVKPTKAS